MFASEDLSGRGEICRCFRENNFCEKCSTSGSQSLSIDQIITSLSYNTIAPDAAKGHHISNTSLIESHSSLSLSGVNDTFRYSAVLDVDWLYWFQY